MKTFLSLVLVLSLVGAAEAAPGDLDTSFNTDGKVITDVPGNGRALALAIQRDGKIVAAGEAGGDLAVLRYNLNGTLDTSFGGDGIVTHSFADVATAIAIDADDRIVVAGIAGNNTVHVVRLLADGTLDTTFGEDGRIEASFGSFTVATGLAIQPDGRIVMVGSVDTGLLRNFLVVRFNPDGTLDEQGFNSSQPGGVPGVVTVDFNGGEDGAVGVAVGPDGVIVVAGDSRRPGDNNCSGGCFALGLLAPTGATLRLTSTSFGPGVPARATGVAVQADGGIVIAGTVGDLACLTSGFNGCGMGVARYLSNGTLDPSFSSDGRVVVGFEFRDSEARAVAIQPDGRIVLAGLVDSDDPQTSSNLNFALARLNTNGALDPTFRGDGKVITDFSAGTSQGTQRTDVGNAMAIQPRDGRIVVAGASDLTFSSDESAFALARYHAFTCNGANVTILGTNGPDTLVGRAFLGIDFDDVIHGLGGNDVIDGLGGNDIICGGDGDDTLSGGSGNDVLIRGARGQDAMDGGRGTDTCVGSRTSTSGPPTGLFDPADTFTLCETVNTGTSGISGEWVTDVLQTCNRSVRNPACVLRGQLRVFNPGAEGTAVRSLVAFYLSEDEVLDENDTFLTTMEVTALSRGGARVIGLNVRLPVTDVSGAFVIAVVDYLDRVPEVNEENNVVVSAAVKPR